jgi:hypothetical protein
MNDQILAVSIEARINKLEKEMKKAAAITGRNFDAMEKRSKRAAGDIENHFAGIGTRIGGIGKNIAAGFVGGLVAGGLMGVVGRFGDVARGIAEIGDEAKRAGIGVEAFQEWKHVAEQARIPTDAMVDALKELNIRADEFAVTGKGSAAQAFARLGLTPTEVQQRLKDPSAFMLELIERTRLLGDTAAGVRVFDELFGGTGGERLVALLSQSQDELRGTIKQARDLGLVLSEELVNDAAELDQKFNLVANTVGTALKSAIVEAASALGSFMEQFQAFEQQSTAGLNQRLREIGLKKLALDNQIVVMQGKLARGEDLFGINRGALESGIAEARKGIAAYIDQEKEILALLESRRPAPAKTDATPTAPEPTAGGQGGMRAQRDAARDVIAALEDELRLLGMSEVEQRVNAELRRAGADATDDQRASIRELAMAIDTEGEAMRQIEAAMTDAKDIAKDFLGGLLGDLRNGVDGANALANAFGNVGDKLIDLALGTLVDGALGGTTGSSLSGLFGVNAATGGHIRGPGTGTSDSIPARLSDGEFVVRASQTAKHLDLLHAINRGEIAAFAAGGLAGDRPALLAAKSNRHLANDNAPKITINAPVTVSGSSGTPEQNADLAQRVARELQKTMSGTVVKEMQRQMRPGNMLNSHAR